MSADRTQSLNIDPLGDAIRARAEIKMTGAQLMDLADERNALRAGLLWALSQLDIYADWNDDSDAADRVRRLRRLGNGR